MVNNVEESNINKIYRIPEGVGVTIRMNQAGKNSWLMTTSLISCVGLEVRSKDWLMLAHCMNGKRAGEVVEELLAQWPDNKEDTKVRIHLGDSEAESVADIVNKAVTNCDYKCTVVKEVKSSELYASFIEDAVFRTNEKLKHTCTSVGVSNACRDILSAFTDEDSDNGPLLGDLKEKYDASMTKALKAMFNNLCVTGYLQSYGAGLVDNNSG